MNDWKKENESRKVTHQEKVLCFRSFELHFSFALYSWYHSSQKSRQIGRQADKHTQILMPFPGSVGIVGFVFIPFKRCIACVIVAVGFVRFFMCMCFLMCYVHC